MSQRVTIMIDDDVNKKLHLIQAKEPLDFGRCVGLYEAV